MKKNLINQFYVSCSSLCPSKYSNFPNSKPKMPFTLATNTFSKCRFSFDLLFRSFFLLFFLSYFHSFLPLFSLYTWFNSNQFWIQLLFHSFKMNFFWLLDTHLLSYQHQSTIIFFFLNFCFFFFVVDSSKHVFVLLFFFLNPESNVLCKSCFIGFYFDFQVCHQLQPCPYSGFTLQTRSACFVLLIHLLPFRHRFFSIHLKFRSRRSIVGALFFIASFAYAFD